MTKLQQLKEDLLMTKLKALIAQARLDETNSLKTAIETNTKINSDLISHNSAEIIADIMELFRDSSTT